MTFQYEVIDHVQLAAPIGGENKAREFFQGLLGFEEVEKPEPLRKRGGVWFRSGSVHVHIGVESDFHPAKKAHPAFHVKNIEAMKEHLQAHDITFKVDDKLPGANRFYLNDPFGNRLEFLEWIK
ncbi:VOC family protein [Virgibacillus ndiopensis]|uniref:VOC family protein n=1 Tax=Virgibacillus ndiopensis TaxID=2004408 RepID=UPI001FE6C18C|nr:VOC family protein [Virgibacillus ndiopensis]